jgi:hypothetical protein
MPRTPFHAVGRLPWAVAWLVVPVALLGCGRAEGVKTVPVAGRITVDGQPLTVENATVLFKPDASHGNTSALEPAGTVDERGNYTLFTGARQGAPPGTYRVLVAAAERRARPFTPARVLVHPRYGRVETSGLTVEVVENPAAGAYDLQLTP